MHPEKLEIVQPADDAMALLGCTPEDEREGAGG